MRDGQFIKRLTQELPGWTERGWVQPGAEQHILADLETRHGSSDRMVIALSLMGAVLLGAGIITFFAAHWDGMSKLAKLLLLFGSMTATYIAAAVTGSRASLPRVSQGLWLLGVILFGANIMLIAQIYNIDSHYPNGVLLWALGGLLVAWLIPAQFALSAAIALGALWTGLEHMDFNRSVHWPYLVFWLACLLPIYRNGWLRALHLAFVGLLLWSCFTYFESAWQFDELGRRSNELYLMQLFFLLYLALFVAGMLLDRRNDTQKFAPITRHYAAFAALAAFLALTYPELQNGERWISDSAGRQPADAWWLALTVLAAAVLAWLVRLHLRTQQTSTHPTHVKWGQALLGLLFALLLANLFLYGNAGSAMALLFNLLFFAALVWLVFHALHINDRTLLNFAFFYFAVWLLSRYFDTFWTLLDRSLFFMAGGVVLLAGGFFLEKQRRRLSRQILQAREH